MQGTRCLRATQSYEESTVQYSVVMQGAGRLPCLEHDAAQLELEMPFGTACTILTRSELHAVSSRVVTSKCNCSRSRGCVGAKSLVCCTEHQFMQSSAMHL